MMTEKRIKENAFWRIQMIGVKAFIGVPQYNEKGALYVQHYKVMNRDDDPHLATHKVITEQKLQDGRTVEKMRLEMVDNGELCGTAVVDNDVNREVQEIIGYQAHNVKPNTEVVYVQKYERDAMMKYGMA